MMQINFRVEGRILNKVFWKYLVTHYGQANIQQRFWCASDTTESQIDQLLDVLYDRLDPMVKVTLNTIKPNLQSNSLLHS